MLVMWAVLCAAVVAAAAGFSSRRGLVLQGENASIAFSDDTGAAAAVVIDAASWRATQAQLTKLAGDAAVMRETIQVLNSTLQLCRGGLATVNSTLITEVSRLEINSNSSVETLAATVRAQHASLSGRVGSLETGVADVAVAIRDLGAASAQERDFLDAVHGQFQCRLASAVPTNNARSWAAFTADEETFLALAIESHGATYDVNSFVYRWDADAGSIDAVPTAVVPTHGATRWHPFRVDGELFLAVANWRNNTSRNTNSAVYHWNATAGTIEGTPVTEVLTHGAQDWETFEASGHTYMTVANYHDGVSYNVESVTYEWNATTWTAHRLPGTEVLTFGASDWESFEVQGQTYLLVANYYNGDFDINSRVYRWNEAAQTLVSTPAAEILTHGASDWESFSVGEDMFLAVANYNNGTTMNLVSHVYKWNTTAGTTVSTPVASVATHGARDWESFWLSGQLYLAVASYSNDTTFSTNSYVYRWDAQSGSLVSSPVTAIRTHGAVAWESFTVRHETYLAVANSRDDTTRSLDSHIYRVAALPL